MGFFDWIIGALRKLGLFQKKATIVFLGLDNAGKTTLLLKLKKGLMGQIAPTQHPTSQTVQIGQVTLNTFDLGGHEIVRRLWTDYTAKANGIVYLLDAADSSRFQESASSLKHILDNQDFEQLPILILANKVDLPQAAGLDEISHQLNITNRRTGTTGHKLAPGQRPLEIFACSIINEEGYIDGFEWLSKYL